MINLYELDKFRDNSPQVLAHYGSSGDDKAGLFMIKLKYDKYPLRIVASNGEGWDHVSVSKEKKIPSWLEMDEIKRLFFKEDEIAFQLHAKPSDHINIHSNCLHIWRPHNLKIPEPPKFMV